MPGKNNPLILVDADALIALSNKADANHQKAERILDQLTTAQAYTLFPATALCEAGEFIRSAIYSRLKNCFSKP